MQLLHIEGLNFSYDKDPVLTNINLDYDNKDFLGLIGPNGGGKSTLLRLILGLHKSNNVHLAIAKQKIGYVPQSIMANENFPICTLELVLMGLLDGKKFGFYSKAEKKLALDTLERVGLSEFAKQKISELSGGQRQKAFIARALVSNCKLLILDEPTASLDSKNSVAVFELLTSLHKEGTGIITVCHDINLILAYADKIAYVNKELILHDNDKEKSSLIAHLNESHKHFCAVEMGKQSCGCLLHQA